MPLKTGSIEEPNLNLTPMIDIVFLLIIFFMVGTQFTNQEDQFAVELPTASTAQPLSQRPDSIVISVSRDGRIVMNGEKKSLTDLQVDLELAKKNYEDQAVTIRGDGSGRYQAVMDVLDVVNAVEIKSISLAYKDKNK